MRSLLALVPPPADVPANDWSLVGEPVPASLRQLVDAYGAGGFDDFLRIWAPGHPNQYADLARQVPRQREIAVQVGDVDPAGLIPFGMTDNGDCLWVTAAGDAVTVTEARGPLTSHHEATPGSFIGGWMRGRIRVRVFPDRADVPWVTPRFEPARR